MIKEKQPKRKQTIIHKWVFQGRPMTIEIYDHAPKLITFFGGAHIPVDKQNYSLLAISRLQKQLRQELYGYLVDNDLNTQNYILKIDAPARPSGSKVYLELVICFEPAEGADLKELEGICEWCMRKIEL